MDQFKVIHEQDYMQQEKGTGAADEAKKIDVALQEYRDMHARYSQQEHQDKVLAQPRIVRRFYDAVTGFYEFGWGSSFHFAPRVNGKNLATCQHRLQEDGDSRHKDIRNRIEYANATPDLPTTQYQADSIKSAGFEILGASDYALKSDTGTPWYISLEGRDFSFPPLRERRSGGNLRHSLPNISQTYPHPYPKGWYRQFLPESDIRT